MRGQGAELNRQAELLQLREDALHRTQLDAVEDREFVARERAEA